MKREQMNAMEAKRVAAGLKRDEVAARLGIDKTTVCKWETGKALPRTKMMRKVAQVYGCTMEELMG